jgi:hypothetical protein
MFSLWNSICIDCVRQCVELRVHVHTYLFIAMLVLTTNIYTCANKLTIGHIMYVSIYIYIYMSACVYIHVSACLIAYVHMCIATIVCFYVFEHTQ